MEFLLDPYILAFPGTSASTEQLRNFFFSLQTWSEEVLKGHHKFWLSYPILESLLAVNQYPSWEVVMSLPSSRWREIETFSAYDVFRACERTLVTPPWIDQALPNHIEFDSEAKMLIPPAIASRLHPKIKEALEQTLALIAYAKEEYNVSLAIHLIFATGQLTSPSESVFIQVNILVPGHDTVAELKSDWRLVTSPEQLDEIEGLQSFWEDTERAVHWAYKNLCACKVLVTDLHSLHTFAVGSSFNDSILKYHYDQNPDILSAIFRATAKVITGASPRGTSINHELWESGNSKVQRSRVRDGAKAWRAHVTQGKLGIRLHYWLTSEGKVEIAQVGPHENYDIG